MNTYSRSYNSIRNVGYGVIKQIATLAMAFATRTVFVRLLGAEYTGINGLYSNILTVLSLAEMGVGNVLLYSLYDPLKNHDIAKVQSLMLYFKKIYNFVAVAVAGFGVAVVPFLCFIVNSDLPQKELILYYLLFLTNSVSSYFVVYKTTLIQADQKEYLRNLVSTIALIVQYIGQIVYLVVTRDFVGYLVIQIVCTLGQNIMLNYLANRMYPFLKEKVCKSSEIQHKELVENIKSMFLYKFATIIINNTDNILISILIGTIAVGYYSNYYALITYVNTFVSLIIVGITASLGNLNAEQDTKKSYQMFCNLIYIFNFITTFCVAAFVCVVQDFVPIWIGKEYLLDMGTVFAILFSFYISTVVSPVWMYRETMGLFKEIKYVMFVTAILNIVFSMLLGVKLGIAGIISATGISRLCTIVWYEPRVLYRRLHQPVIKYFLMQFKYLLLNMICILGSVMICYFMGHSFIWITIKIFVCGCIVLFVYVLAVRINPEYQWIKNKFCDLFWRKRRRMK